MDLFIQIGVTKIQGGGKGVPYDNGTGLWKWCIMESNMDEEKKKKTLMDWEKTEARRVSKNRQGLYGCFG